MKALTLTQPWASLIAIGAKQIETRSWFTKYRGPLAIHAAKSFPHWAQEFCLDEPFFSAFKKAGIVHEGNWITDLPLGQVVATCNLFDCVEIPPMGLFSHKRKTIRHGTTTFLVPPKAPELTFGNYDVGRFAWLLTDISSFVEPKQAKGAQGLWEWIPPT